MTETITPVEVCTCGTDKKIRLHLARAVVRGRAITVHLLHREVTGYLAGWYSDSLLLLTPEDDGKVRRQLILRASVTMIDLHDEETYAGLPAPAKDRMEPIIGPFRTAMYRVLPASKAGEVAQ